MAVLVSTEVRRVVGVLAIGSAIATILWVTHLHTSGLVWLLTTVGSLGIAGLTVAFGVSVLVEGRIDARARTRMVQRLRPGTTEASANTNRCLLCRRPLIVICGVALCATCDQKPTP